MTTTAPTHCSPVGCGLLELTCSCCRTLMYCCCTRSCPISVPLTSCFVSWYVEVVAVRYDEAYADKLTRLRCVTFSNQHTLTQDMESLTYETHTHYVSVITTADTRLHFQTPTMLGTDVTVWGTGTWRSSTPIMISRINHKSPGISLSWENTISVSSLHHSDIKALFTFRFPMGYDDRALDL